MSKILTTDVAIDPPNPASGTHALYSKTAGLFVKDSAGVVVGPLGTGGGGGISELTGDVTAGPGSGAQAATIAPLAVTTGKIDNKAVDVTKLADPNGGTFSFLWADTATSWKSDLPDRVKFSGPSRVSVLGDAPVNPYDPQNLRLVNSVGPDVDLGYLARTQRSQFPAGSGSPPGLPLDNGFTFYEIALNFTSWYLLPDCRSYPPGTEIVIVNTTSAGSGLDAFINETGGFDPNRAIVGPSAATGGPQIIGDDYRGRRFLTNGSSGWILIGVF